MNTSIGYSECIVDMLHYIEYMMTELKKDPQTPDVVGALMAFENVVQHICKLKEENANKRED